MDVTEKNVTVGTYGAGTEDPYHVPEKAEGLHRGLKPRHVSVSSFPLPPSSPNILGAS